MTPRTQELVRLEFSHLDGLYFNTAYFGPSPLRVKQKVENALKKELDPSFFPYNAWMGIPDKMRRHLSKLLKCNFENIAHATSVTDTINLIANGFPFKDDDRVVCFKGDYPSNVIPWMLPHQKWGLKLSCLECFLPTSDWLRDHLPADTRILDISYVAFDSGRKIDLLDIGKFCRERDIIFIVDATQAFGGMPITEEELSYIDVLACSCYKWLLGPYGTSFAYYSDKMVSLIKSKSGNWINSPNSKQVWNLLEYTTETLSGARKFDRGQAPNMLANAALEASLELLDEVGLNTIHSHNTKLQNYFIENFPSKKYEIVTPLDSMGHILSLKSKNADSLHLEEDLKFYNIDVSVRQGKLRLSFHLFNRFDQIDLLIEALDKTK